MRTITPLRKAAIIILLALFALSLISIAIPTIAAEPGQALAPNCQANIAIGDTGSIPTAAVQAIVDSGGTVTIERNAPWLYQLVVRTFVLHEDDERWGTITDYEVECR